MSRAVLALVCAAALALPAAAAPHSGYTLSAGLGSYTVSTLPTCNTAAKGRQAFVTDATSPTYNGTLTGGGAVAVPAFCNGTAWTAH